MKYLLVMYDKGTPSDERWGTWGTPALFYEETYVLEDEGALIASIGEFKEDRPNGDVSIHIIEEIGWGTEKHDYIYNLIKCGSKKAEEITKKKEEAEKQRLIKVREKQLAGEKARELEQLKRLQEKYKDSENL